MSTHDIPDNELDDFFRKSLEEPAIDFREEDWLKMEKKLNAATRQNATFRRYLYSVLLLLFLGISIPTVFWINNRNTATETAHIPEYTVSEDTDLRKDNPELSGGNTSDEPTASQPATSNPDNSNTADHKQPEEPAEEKKSSREYNVLQESVREQTSEEKEIKVSGVKDKEDKTGKINPLRGQPGAEKTAPVRQPAIGDGGPAAIKSGETTGTEPTTDRDINTRPGTGRRIRPDNPNTGKGIPRIVPGNSLTYVNGKPAENKLPAENDQDTEDSKWDKAGTTLAVATAEYTGGIENSGLAWPLFSMSGLQVKQLSADSQFPQKYTQALKHIVPAGAQPVDSADVKRLAKRRINYRFSISLLLSPDISTVRLSGLTRPGTNVGMLLSYRFSPRISMSTGLLRSAKIYDARTEDYSPPPGQWIYYVKPVQIKAACTVLDIPLNVRYNLSVRENYTLYAVAGLSSYLMLSEYYRYIYDVDDTHLRKYWQVNNQNKHFFKVYNLSAGYERRLGRRLSAGAEPYLKIPGAGVGFGKIQLWSAGVFISANYQFGK
jgi:hypothetical protein